MVVSDTVYETGYSETPPVICLYVAIPAFSLNLLHQMRRLRTRHAAAVVVSDEVGIVVGVDLVVAAQLYHLFESVVDEDEADERREAFLRETREVLHQEAGVCGDQHQTEHSRPQADPQPELKVVEPVVSEERHRFGTAGVQLCASVFVHLHILFPSKYNPTWNSLNFQ